MRDVRDDIVLWTVVAMLAALCVFSLVAGGWLGWLVAAFFAWQAADMARFTLRLRRSRIKFERDLETW